MNDNLIDVSYSERFQHFISKLATNDKKTGSIMTLLFH
jgi:hypothetical protein